MDFEMLKQQIEEAATEYFFKYYKERYFLDFSPFQMMNLRSRI